MSEQWDGAGFRTQVQATLDAFLDEQADVVAPLGEDAARLVERARSAVSGGKRLRAAFAYWGHRAVDASPADEAALLRACSGLEMLHASALVHDDLMDASDTRRGQPAAHRVLEQQHREAGWRGDPEQYGAGGAILLGDLLLSWAEQLVRRAGLPADRTAVAVRLFDLTRTEVIAGQFLDISVQARGRADVGTAMTVLRYKSAKYSVERPLHVGAALAGADDAQLTALTDFGLPLGEAFQLRDDVLGVFGDPATTGKPAGDDLVEGKRTVLVARALETASPADARVLDESLGTPLAPDQVEELRRVITESGAAARVEEEIAALAQRSVEALERSVADGRLDAGAADVLRTLATAATQRVL